MPTPAMADWAGTSLFGGEVVHFMLRPPLPFRSDPKLSVVESEVAGVQECKIALSILRSHTAWEDLMPNGGSDCCGTCWFNRSLGGQLGSDNFNREIPSHCEIRELDISDPFYTYCANHPHHRPVRDPIPIGPVYVPAADGSFGDGRREPWQPSPDTEEIRQHLLDLVRLPEEHADKGYRFYTPPAYIEAAQQLLEWRDERVISALEDFARRQEAKGIRADIEESIRLVRERLGT